MDKRVSRQYFNQAAGSWDDTVRNNDPDKLQAMLNRIDLPADGWILDVGTGTGVFLPYICESVNSKSRIFSLDYAINMLGIARSKQKRSKIQFICAEIETLHLGSELFDYVICYSTFPHFHDKPLALRNIHRILKPGGTLAICHTASREAINQIHRSIPDFSDHLIPDDSQMKALLIDAGFKNHKINTNDDYYLITARK